MVEVRGTISVIWKDLKLFDRFQKSLIAVEHLTVLVFEVLWSDRSVWRSNIPRLKQHQYGNTNGSCRSLQFLNLVLNLISHDSLDKIFVVVVTLSASAIEFVILQVARKDSRNLAAIGTPYFFDSLCTLLTTH